MLTPPVRSRERWRLRIGMSPPFKPASGTARVAASEFRLGLVLLVEVLIHDADGVEVPHVIGLDAGDDGDQAEHPEVRVVVLIEVVVHHCSLPTSAGGVEDL